MITDLKKTFSQPNSLHLSLSMLTLYIGTSAYQYHSLLFESRGFWGNKLGMLFMLGYGAAGLSPAINTLFTQRFKTPAPPLLFYLVIAGSTLGFLPLVDSFWGLAVLYMVHTFSVAAVFPLHLAFGIDICRNLGHQGYYVFRAIGTFGFMAGCIVCAFLIKYISFSPVYLFLALFYAITFFSVFRVHKKAKTSSTGKINSPGKDFSSFSSVPPDQRPPKKGYSAKPGATSLPPSKSFSQKIHFLLFNKQMLMLLFFLGVLSFANTMAVTVVGNYLQHQFSASTSLVSWAWALSTGFEIPIMFLGWFTLKKWGIEKLVSIGVVATIFRLCLMALAPNLGLFLFALCFHGFFYATYTSTLGIWIDNLNLPQKHSMQILFSLIYFGVPNALGSFLTGYIWEIYSLQHVFYVSGVISLISGIGYFFLRGGLRGTSIS